MSGESKSGQWSLAAPEGDLRRREGEEAGRIVIEPVREKKYKLDDLLKEITKDNIHEEIDFGVPEGREVW